MFKVAAAAVIATLLVVLAYTHWPTRPLPVPTQVVLSSSPGVEVVVQSVPVVVDSKGFVKLPDTPIRGTITVNGQTHNVTILSKTLYSPVKPFLTPMLGVGIATGLNVQNTSNLMPLVGFKLDAPLIGESVIAMDSRGGVALLKPFRVGDNLSVLGGVSVNNNFMLLLGIGVDL